MTRKTAALLILLLLVLQALPAQVDRTKMPGPGPAPAVAFPQYDKRVTSNGIRLIVVRNTELPTLDIQLLIDRKPILEGAHAGYVDLAGQLLRTGTATKSKDQLDDAIDRIGATIGSSGTSVFASGLSRYTDELVALTADIVLHPSFPKEELDRLVTQEMSGLKARKTEPDAVVELLRQKILYGESHPYGEQETEETVGRITREKCLELYSTYFKPNAAIIAIVGDIDTDRAMSLVEKYFGSWQKGTIPEPTFETPKALPGVTVALVDRPGAPQSVLRVGQTVSLPHTSADVIPATVMNSVLGGSSAARLFLNLREKHAYTYGAYSGIGPDELIGAFTVRSSVKSAITDSALMEIFSEMKRMQEETVNDNELRMAKNYLSGSFVRSLENARTIANYAISIERHKLPPRYYQDYLKNLDMVSASDVQRMARTYLTPGKVLVAVVGPSKEVKAKLGVFGSVQSYDEEGRIVVERSAPVTMKADEILGKYVAKTGGKSRWAALKDRTSEFTGKVQNFEMKIRNVQKAPNKLYQEMSIPGMFKQQMGFDGKAGWSISPQGSGDLTGEQLDAVKEQSVMNFYGDYKKLGYAAEVGGVKSIKGKDTYEIIFSRPNTGTVRHYFATDDFLKVREVRSVKTPQGSVDQTTDFADYKDFNGFLVPTKSEQSAMGQVITLTLEKFEVNTGVKDDVFKKPATK